MGCVDLNWRVILGFAVVVLWSIVPIPQISVKSAQGAINAERDTCLHAADTMAIRACEKVLSADPDDLQVLLKLSQHLAVKQDYESAIKIMEQAKKYHPDSTKVKHNLKKLISYHKEQKWKEKRTGAGKEVTTSSRGSTEYKLLKIRCLRLKGKSALEACNRAIQEIKDDPSLYKARAAHLEALGRNQEATRDYSLAAKYNPARPLESASADIEEKPKEVQRISKKRDKIKLKMEEVPEPQGAEPAPEANIAADQSPKKEKVVVQPEESSVQVSQPAGGPSPETPAVSGSETTIKKLATLKGLYENSLISRGEYERRREALLDSLVTVPKRKTKKHVPAIDPNILGNYHALVIGEQDYQFLPKLKTAKRDAESVAEVLTKHYGFKVKILMDASRRDILLALSAYRRTLSKDDNLLIYYAGHGWLDEKADVGYWLPVEAVEENKVDWISMATLTSSVRVLEAKHVLIVADSCFSGKLARGLFMQDRNPDYLARIAKKRTRVVLTSGGLEPVLDGGGKGGHSVFAATFLKVLQDNKEIMDGSTLFTKIRRPVMLKAQQVPEYSDIRMAGHEGGDFVFLPVEPGDEN